MNPGCFCRQISYFNEISDFLVSNVVTNSIAPLQQNLNIFHNPTFHFFSVPGIEVHAARSSVKFDRIMQQLDAVTVRFEFHLHILYLYD